MKTRPKKIQSEISDFVRGNPLILSYSLLGTSILSFILYAGSHAQLKQALAYAFLLALPICLGSDYMAADGTLRKKWIAPFAGIVFGLGFFIVRILDAPIAFQAHLLAAVFLLLLLAPRSIRLDEKIGFHWMICILFAIGSSLTISGVILGLVSFLVWVVNELFQVKPPKLINSIGLSFFAVFLPINIFAFFKPRPDAVATLRYNFTSAIERLIKVLFVPVLLIYLVVLLSYTAKILLELKLPQGMISIPISVAYGIFFALDAYIESQDRKIEGVWKYRNWIRIAFIPLFVMMGVGIGVRIAEYGLTQERIYLVMGFLSILASAFVRLWWRALELRKLIGFTAALFLLTSAGPLTPLNLTAQSQMNRFLETIGKYGTGYGGVGDFKLSTWSLPDISSAHSSLQLIRFAKREAALEKAANQRGIFVEFAKGDSIQESLKELERQLSRLNTIQYGKQESEDRRVCQSFEVSWATRSSPARISGYDWRVEIDLLGNPSARAYRIPDLADSFEIKMDTQSLYVVGKSGSEEVIQFGDPIRELVATFGAVSAPSPVVLNGRTKKYQLQLIVWRADLDCNSPRLDGVLLVGVQR